MIERSTLNARWQTVKSKAKGPTTVPLVKSLILLSIVCVVLLQFVIVHRHHGRYAGDIQQWYNQDVRTPSNGTMRNEAAAGSKDAVNKNEYVMWSKEEAYFNECKTRFLRNDTWGKMHAPYVDKIEAKVILARSNVPDLKIIPTLATLDKSNVSEYSLEFMQSLPQPYIIKASHVSGGVARVYNNTYHCFKFCNNKKVLPLNEAAFIASQKQLDEDMNTEYETLGGERQYKFITPRIIFEEDIISGGKTVTDVTFWWLANGHPVFVSHQCGERKKNQQGFQMKRVFVSTDFRRLPIIFNRDTCEENAMPEQPKRWDTQLKVAKQIGKLFPGEVVRLDIYGGGNEVWLSEFTFTTGGCWKTFTPRVTDGLLYAVAHGMVATESITADYVQRTLSDDSWVVVSFDKNGNKLPEFSGAYPSPVDMCMVLEDLAADNTQNDKRMRLFQSCIKVAQKVKNHPLRCIITHYNASRIRSFGGSPFDLVDDIENPTNVDICTAKHRQQV